MVGYTVYINHNSSTATATATIPHISYSNNASAPAAVKGPPPQIDPSRKTLNAVINGKNGGICYYGACYYYVTSVLGANSATGATATITQSQPIVDSKDSHSLIELAVESSATRQIVEIGWTVDQWLNGDLKPHLFVYHWVNGSPTCYNGCGFVATSNKYTAGGLVTSGTTGIYGINFSNNRWVLTYNGTELGYFPESIWSGSFTSIDMAQAFGEIASGSSYTPETQMGNGIMGTKSKSSQISNFSLIGAINPSGLGVSSVGATNKYKYSNVTSNGFNLGGPGYKSVPNPYINLDNTMISGLGYSVGGNCITTPGSTISSVVWNWGDGNKNIVSNFPASHTYAKTGNYKVTATCTDSSSLSSSSSIKVGIR